MTHRLIAPLRDAPATLPALAALALLITWATSQAGYPLTHWAPGALLVLALLGIALLAAPPRLASMPLALKLALGGLLAYTALSYLSILWADAPGEAWEGANRTLLYLLVFALFSCWRARGASAGLLLCVWTLALALLACYVAVRLYLLTGHSFGAMFSGERLAYPVGYPNANAAQWLMAFWPALLLARSRSLPWALRGALAGGAVVLADVALLSQSRGSLYSTPVMIVLVFALIPNRLRTFAVCVPIAIAVGASAPFVLRVGNQLADGRFHHATAHTAVVALLLAGALVAVAVALAAAFERSRAFTPARARSLRRGLAALSLITLLALALGGLVLAGNPVTRVRHAWDSFKGGYPSNTDNADRLLSGLGSNRYDFYRVALDQLTAHPLLGIGVDNFQQQYLIHGRSDEAPRYPHSVELRTLAETGLVGALIALVGLGAALAAGWHAMRRGDPLSRAVAAAALAGFGYWVVHGSFDWFWEFAGLGASAFALLGIVCSLYRPGGLPASSPTVTSRRPGAAGRWLAVLVGGLLALVGALSLTAPWLSERQILAAASIWPKAPFAAYKRLSSAASLNPLSDRAYVVEGSIALRFGDLARAERAFSRALSRVPGDAYAALELGAIASELGRRADALELLGRAARLNPRDPITAQALARVRAGKRVSVEALNRSILLKAEQLA